MYVTFIAFQAVMLSPNGAETLWFLPLSKENSKEIFCNNSTHLHLI